MAAMILDITVRAVRKQAASGKLESRTVLGEKGKKKLEVFVEVPEDLVEASKRNPETDQAIRELEEMMDGQGLSGTDRDAEDTSVRIAPNSQARIGASERGEDADKDVRVPGGPDGTLCPTLTSFPAVQAEKMELSTEAEVREQLAFLEYSQSDREIAWARKAVVEIWERFRSSQVSQGLSKSEADLKWDVNSHLLCETELVKLGMRDVASKTIHRWGKMLREAGNINYPLSLISSRHNSGRKSVVSDELMARIRQLAADPRNHRASSIYKQLLSEHPDRVSFPIKERTLTRLVAEVRKDEALISVFSGKTRFKNNVKPHVKRINDNIAGSHYVSDGRKCDFFVASPWPLHVDPSYRYLVRPLVVFWQDISTGLIAGYSASYAESTHLVLNALHMAVLKWGVPARITIDNGTSYQNYITDPLYFFNHRKAGSGPWNKAKQFIDAGSQGVYREIGIKHITYSKPRNPEGKTIEAHWNIVFEDFERKQPLYAGKNAKERPEYMNMTSKALIKQIGGNVPTWNDFILDLNALVNIWNTTKRPVLRSVMGEEMSPVEAFKSEVTEIVIPSKSWLNEKLNIPVLSSVQRDGIYCAGNYYWHPQNIAQLGNKCLVRFDEMDPSTAIISSENDRIWAGLAEATIKGSFIDAEQCGDANAQARHNEKVGLITYTEVRSEMPGKLDQSKVNKIASKTLEQIDHKAEERREIIKNTGVEKISTPKRKKTAEGSGVLPDPEMMEAIEQMAKEGIEVMPANAGNVEELSTEEKMILDRLERNSSLRGV
jgi:hypothetical protein